MSILESNIIEREEWKIDITAKPAGVGGLGSSAIAVMCFDLSKAVVGIRGRGRGRIKVVEMVLTRPAKAFKAD